MIRTATGLVCIALLTSCKSAQDSGGYAAPMIEPVVVVEDAPPAPPPPSAEQSSEDQAALREAQMRCQLAGICPDNGGSAAYSGSSATRGVLMGSGGNPSGRPRTGSTRGMQVRPPNGTLAVRGTTFEIRAGDPEAQATPPAPPPTQSRQGRGSQGNVPPPLALDTPPPASADPCAPGEPPSLNLPQYEPWPPEQPSSRIPIDDLIAGRSDLTLYDTGQLLREALNQAGYQQHAFYAVPGGYILVTETERTDPEGVGVTGVTRYQRPGEDRTGLFVSIRDLFLERPETYYRYLAIVVSDRQFCLTREALDMEEASQRVLGGFVDLSDDTRAIAFDDRYRVTALIYEFKNDGIGYDLSMIAPGRIPPREHLERSGLSEALPRVFSLGGNGGG